MNIMGREGLESFPIGSRERAASYAALFPIFDVLLRSYRRAPGYLETGLDEAPRTLLPALAWPPSQRAAKRACCTTTT